MVDGEIKISIVTINYNARNEVLKTFESVIDQVYGNFEWILIDGCSDDGIDKDFAYFKKTLSEKNRGVIILSEKDAGIYDAMNKGLNLVSGHFCIMLNSGDTFHDSNALENIVSKITSLDLIYYGRARVEMKNSFYYKPSRKALDITYIKNYPVHQSVLIPRLFFDFRYDTQFDICGDTVYLAELFKKSPPIFLNVDFVIFHLGGVSSHPPNFKKYWQLLSESVKVVSRYDIHKWISVPRIVFTLSIKYFFFNILSINKFERFFFFFKKR